MSTNEMYRQMLTNAVSGSALMGGCCGSALMGGATGKSAYVNLPNPNYNPKKIDGKKNPAYNPNEKIYRQVLRDGPEHMAYKSTMKYQSALADRTLASYVSRVEGKRVLNIELNKALEEENAIRIADGRKPVKHLPKFKKCEIKCRESQITHALRNKIKNGYKQVGMKVNPSDVDKQVYDTDIRNTVKAHFESGAMTMPGGGRQKGYKMTEEAKNEAEYKRYLTLEKKFGGEKKS